MRLKLRILKFIGDVKLQKWPPFMYYQPGPYYNVTGALTAAVISIARPGDIVLRGYNDYLDNVFIPGLFSHSGIYIGHGIVIHAVALGVTMCSLIDFMRCDLFALVRPVRGQKQAVERANNYIGCPYDYDFKSDNNAFYCHLLVALCYKELEPKKVTPYYKFIRFSSMAPTYLAESFLNNPNFKLITKKGKL